MDFKDKFGRQWVADQGFKSGLYGRLNITGPETPFNNWPYQKTTRYFLYATSNCYSLPLGSGRYLIRFFFNPGPMTDAGDPVSDSNSIKGVLLSNHGSLRVGVVYRKKIVLP